MKTKGSFIKSQKREGLATVDVNRFPQQRQPRRQQPIKRCLSSSSSSLLSSPWSCNNDDSIIIRSAAREEACKYSQEELVTIRQNLSANLALAKRRVMDKLSRSNIPQDMQMYEYLSKSSERNKKRRNQKTKNNNAAPMMNGGKLKQHRPQPLLKKTPPKILHVNNSGNSPQEVIVKKEENEAQTAETSLSFPTITMVNDSQEATAMVTEDESIISTPSTSQQLQPLLSPIANGEELVGGGIKTAEPVVPLDILFGGYYDEIMTTTDEEPNSLCDPSSSPLIPACVRDPVGGNEEAAAWDMSNHAAGLLNGLLYDEDTQHTIDNVAASREPIDFWVENTMVISDQDMSGKYAQCNP